MRRLGAELGVDPMAVYYHVPNKAALLDAIVEAVMAKIDLDGRPLRPRGGAHPASGELLPGRPARAHRRAAHRPHAQPRHSGRHAARGGAAGHARRRGPASGAGDGRHERHRGHRARARGDGDGLRRRTPDHPAARRAGGELPGGRVPAPAERARRARRTSSARTSSSASARSCAGSSSRLRPSATDPASGERDHAAAPAERPASRRLGAPVTVLEPAAAVLLRAARRLHDAVER